MQRSRKQLTGRLDVRTGWFGRQIIRVQEETQTTSYVVNPLLREETQVSGPLRSVRNWSAAGSRLPRSGETPSQPR